MIKGVDINPSGFAFIQFNTVEEAQNACQHENGTIFNKRKVEVRMFDKSNHPTKSRGGRDRSPIHRGSAGGPTGTRHGAPLPPSSYYDYNPPPPPPPVSQPPGNDAEIIVINKDQWGYAEIIERRIRREAAIEYIDMLFLHSPSLLNVTLNDLYERRTLYAIVITPINEQHRSLTLHVLHNQTEHRNMPLEDAIGLIRRDFQSFLARKGIVPPVPSVPFPESGPLNTVPPPVPQSSNYEHGMGPVSIIGNGPNPTLTGPNRRLSATGSGDLRLSEEMAYLLRTVIQEEGPQFLSLPQIDSIIDYFTREKRRLMSQTNHDSSSNHQQSLSTQSQQHQHQHQPQQASGGIISSDLEQQRANLLENPHVKAALSSLLQIGAISSMNLQGSGDQLSNTAGTSGGFNNTSGFTGFGNIIPQGQGQGSVNSNSVVLQGQGQAPLRRHPLLGTEIGTSSVQNLGVQSSTQNQLNNNSNIGMVQYPPPLSRFQ